MVKLEIIGEYRVLVGQNARENTELIKQANPDDIWFHFETVSSPHIILETNGDLLNTVYLNETASLLFKYKKNVQDNVIYTEVKNVKLTKTPGLVEPKNVRIINFSKKL